MPSSERSRSVVGSGRGQVEMGMEVDLTSVVTIVVEKMQCPRFAMISS